MNHIANYLKKLTIENFQSHVKTTIEPAPPGGLTIITGPSDSGKTVILRALRWVFNNQPQGNDFIRVGASFARTTVDYASSHAVIRERTKATNRYKIVALDAPGGDEAKYKPQVFEGFGNSVPLEVQELTGVRPVKIGDLEFNLNLAEQLDGPFLGSSISGGARAKVLGKLAGTEEIDYASKHLGTDLYRKNQDEKRLAGEVAELEEKVKAFDWLPDAARKIEALEALVRKIKKNQDQKNKVSELKERLQQVDEKITTTQAVLYRWRHLGNAEEHLNRAIRQQYGKDLLVKLANNYWTFQKSIYACEKIIKQYAGLPEAEEKLQGAQGDIQKAGQLRSLKANYLAGQEMIQRSQDILSGLEGLGQAEELLWSLNARKQRLERLEGLSAKWLGKDAAVVGTQKLIEKLAKVEEADKILVRLYTNQELKKNFVSLKNCLRRLDGDIEKSRGQAVMWENRVAELEGAYHDLLESAGICPLCGATTSEMRIKEVI